jgi:beta-lactamase regulating signal transducer with metallopeptidase domain
MVSRALTTFTVGFLLLDALLLAYSGVALGRRWLVFWGAVCLVAAVLVVIGWRRYRRVVSDLERARREMRAEVESIRQLLQGKHLDN